ncbi:MAG: acyl-CoA dehydrogenase family protein [Rubrivivax sp.]
MDTLLADAFGKFLAGHCTPAVVREVERTQQATDLWAQIEASGYLDLLVPESGDGAGLGLREGFDVWLACGQHALPVPLAPTMWLRAVLAHAGIDAPPGPMAIAPQCSRANDGAVRCQAVPFGAVADWVLVADAQGCALWPVAPSQRSSTGVHGSLQAHLAWTAAPRHALALPTDVAGLHVGALLTATAMAGAMQRVLELTVRYANERSQFGKSIGKFQAVQQQLSVMAEQVFAARMAAQIGCVAEAGDEIRPDALRTAVAKARTSEAAQQVVAIAHAVHGAIGITGEYDLQLYTRRLQEWRGDFGSQAHWHAQLGAALLAAPQSATLPFLLAQLLLPTAA